MTEKSTQGVCKKCGNVAHGGACTVLEPTKNYDIDFSSMRGPDNTTKHTTQRQTLDAEVVPVRNCDAACDTYRHTPTCRVAHGDGPAMAAAAGIALVALDALVGHLKPGDPDGPVAFYITHEEVGHYTRAFQVLRENGLRS